MTVTRINIEIPINNNSATYNKDNKVNKLVTFFAFCPRLPRQLSNWGLTRIALLPFKKTKITVTNSVHQDNFYRDTPFAQTTPTLLQKSAPCFTHCSL